ncbi:MAG TPA: AAA family ATPase [Leptospiraceae bacterium]|nr:AAA family ATPase [Leptospiraceae bacterium]
MKKLPIGIQTFSKITAGDYSYADKTKMIAEPADRSGYNFLSRPRRFGKSLFPDTLKEAFEGNKELFQGPYPKKKWNWDKKYPILRPDLCLVFSREVSKTVNYEWEKV